MRSILILRSLASPNPSTKPFCSSRATIPAAVDCATWSRRSNSFSAICFSGEKRSSISAPTWDMVRSWDRKELLACFSSPSWICLISVTQVILSFTGFTSLGYIIARCCSPVNSLLLIIKK